MENIKAFLEADALRTQGEWSRGQDFTVQPHIASCQTAEIANFIAAASRIVPDIRQLLAAFEQVCVALETVRHRDSRWHDDEVVTPALTAAALYRKLGGV